MQCASCEKRARGSGSRSLLSVVALCCIVLALAIHSAYCIKRFSLLTAMMSNKLLGLGLGVDEGWSSAKGAMIEAPKALRGVRCGEGVSHWGRGLGMGLRPLLKNFFWHWNSKWRVLVHSECYFYHFSCLFYKRKPMILALGLGKPRIRCVHVISLTESSAHKIT